MLVPTVKYQILDIWMSNIRALICGTQHSIFGTQYSGFDIYAEFDIQLLGLDSEDAIGLNI